MQEVESHSGDAAGIVFYKAGSSKTFDGIEVDRPCVVMLKKSYDGLKVSVADPTQLLNEINLTVSGNYSAEDSKAENGKTKLKVSLPQNEEAGKTVTLKLNKR